MGSAGGHSVISQAPFYQLVMGQGAAARTGEENIPDRSKGNLRTSCHSE